VSWQPESTQRNNIVSSAATSSFKNDVRFSLDGCTIGFQRSDKASIDANGAPYHVMHLYAITNDSKEVLQLDFHATTKELITYIWLCDDPGREAALVMPLPGKAATEDYCRLVSCETVMQAYKTLMSSATCPDYMKLAKANIESYLKANLEKKETLSPQI
jgi:hypothetical protein